jgi:hypothetical protein
MRKSISSLNTAGVPHVLVASTLPPPITDGDLRDSRWNPPDIAAIKPLRMASDVVDAYRRWRSHLESSHQMPLSRVKGLVKVLAARDMSLRAQINEYGTALSTDGALVRAVVGNVSEANIAQRYLPRAMFVPANVVASGCDLAGLSTEHRLVVAGRVVQLTRCAHVTKRQLDVANACLRTLEGGADADTESDDAESDGGSGETDIDDDDDMNDVSVGENEGWGGM